MAAGRLDSTIPPLSHQPKAGVVVVSEVEVDLAAVLAVEEAEAMEAAVEEAEAVEEVEEARPTEAG